MLVLAVASAVFGWYMMRDSDTHGADFVVLTMFFGMLFAFAVAIVNWIVDRLIGFRFLSRIAQQTTFVMVPPLFLIFLVLGTIFIGVATPTEGGAMGASGALILGALKRRLTWDLVRQAIRIHREAFGLRDLHPDRRAGILADILRRQRAHLGREHAHIVCRAARSAF